MDRIKQWEKASDDLAKYFVKKYFGKDASETYWIANDIGGCMVVNDYFFAMENMVDYLRYKYSVEDMFAHYDYDLESVSAGLSPINIRNWKKLGKPTQEPDKKIVLV